MNPERYLIVNADDFGQDSGINRGIIKAHVDGIVTSASLMVRWPAAQEAARDSLEHPELSLGLHFDICEWAYKDGEWVRLYEVVSEQDPLAVADEAARQLERFRHLTRRDPTHIDSHQHVHRDSPTRAVLLALAQELSVPLRSCDARVRYCGDFYGQTSNGFPYPQGITTDHLIEILRALPPGINELGCHPGLEVEMNATYRSERTDELKTLCHPDVRAAIQNQRIKLCSFRDINGLTMTSQ